MEPAPDWLASYQIKAIACFFCICRTGVVHALGAYVTRVMEPIRPSIASGNEVKDAIFLGELWDKALPEGESHRQELQLIKSVLLPEREFPTNQSNKNPTCKSNNSTKLYILLLNKKI